MIPEIIKLWDANKGELENYFKTNKQSSYSSYEQIVKALFEHVINTSEDENYNINDITVIDHGHYQGTQLFIIPRDTYQPNVEDYLITHTYYGSCSGCDTLLSINSSLEDTLPSEKQVKEYMTLALHLVQKMKKLG